MPSIYEALMRAAEEREALKKKPSPPAPAESSDPPRYVVEDEMLVLLEAMESLLLHSGRAIVQFVGPPPCMGSSSMAREYARFSASATGLQVLFLEPGKPGPDGDKPGMTTLDVGGKGSDGVDHAGGPMFQKVEGVSLFTSARANEVLLTSHRVSSPSDDLMWNLLRDRFGLIVVDSFPCQGDDSHLSLAPDVDGVALVLESDMTVPDASGAGGAGLAEVLDLVARGVLIPRKVVNCMGAHVLLLTPLEG